MSYIVYFVTNFLPNKLKLPYLFSYLQKNVPFPFACEDRELAMVVAAHIHVTAITTAALALIRTVVVVTITTDAILHLRRLVSVSS